MSKATASLRRSATFLFLTGAAAAFVGAPAISAAQTAAGAPITIKATELEPSPNPSLAFNRMADAMGLFAKYGLKLDLGPKLGGGGPARVQAVVTGNTEIATSDIISVMGGIYSGAKIKILMVMTPYGDEEIWGQDKYKTLKDAVGQTWGVASLGGAQRFNAQMTAVGMGFKPDAFQWVAISGADGARLQALDTGRTQLTNLSHLGAALAEAKGFTKQVHPVVLHTSQHTPPVPRLVVVAQTSWLKDHQDAATRYVEMMLDANRQWQNNASIRLRIFTVSNIIAFVSGVAMFGTLAFLPQYMQLVHGVSATESGLLLLPLLFGLLFMSISSGRYIRIPVSIGGSRWPEPLRHRRLDVADPTRGPYPACEVGLYILVFGAGLGLFMQVLVLVVQNAAPMKQMGVATSSVTFFRSMGGAIGASALGAVLTAAITREFGRFLPPTILAGGGDKVAQLVQSPQALDHPQAHQPAAARGDHPGILACDQPHVSRWRCRSRSSASSRPCSSSRFRCGRRPAGSDRKNPRSVERRRSARAS